MNSQGDLDPNCLFCRWIRERATVETLGMVAAFNDGYPVTKGHLLIVPLRHTVDWFSMTAQEIRDSEALIRALSEKHYLGTSSASAFFPSVLNPRFSISRDS